jgi:hypothetical protein
MIEIVIHKIFDGQDIRIAECADHWRVFDSNWNQIGTVTREGKTVVVDGTLSYTYHFDGETGEVIIDE